MWVTFLPLRKPQVTVKKKVEKKEKVATPITGSHKKKSSTTQRN
jgi:hypothetical protein